MATKATLNEAAKVVTGTNKATLQDMADFIVKNGIVNSSEFKSEKERIDSIQNLVNTLKTETDSLENQNSILQTSAVLSEEIGGETVVALDDLLAFADIDSRPSNKSEGATVYDENGSVGVISNITGTSATIVTLVTSASVGVSTEVAQTSESSQYVIHLPQNMVIMGGIKTIEVLGPGVADNDIYIQLPSTVAHVNYVPKITIITASGAFEEIAADVGTRTTEGFYVCARNNDTESINNIQVAWEIVGLRA